ncbi:hypothetical protein CSB90_3501 [Pseudomonas aeruginosa]|nr:hypothetical protein CSB90_3501 [Pseudomonas aeruginosa]
MRVVMVTQDLDQLASWAVLLVETTYRMVKKSKNHVPGRYLQRRGQGRQSAEVEAAA